MRRFGASLRRATPKGQDPSSPAQHRIKDPSYIGPSLRSGHTLEPHKLFDIIPRAQNSALRGRAEVVRSLDANMPMFGVRTMGDFFEQRSVKLLHMINSIVGVVGVLGLGLALVGLYAIVAYQVARRTREIGIRMAIGADRTQVMKMILRQAAAIGFTGVGIGVVLCFAGGRALTVALSAPAFDPILFTLVAVALLLTTLLAAAIPARRAAQVDPMLALRQD